MGSSVQMQSEIDVLNRKLLEQQSLLSDLNVRVTQLQSVMEKEQRDVERLENDGFLSSLLKLLGRHEGKLTNEQAEYLEAKLNYEKCIYDREEASRQIEQLERKIKVHEAEAANYSKVLMERRMKLESLPQGAPQRILFDRFLDKETSQRKYCVEIKEAYEACEAAIAYTADALKDLNSAEGWANWDAFANGGLFTDMAKYDKINAAGAKLQQVRASLGHLSRELADINETIQIPHVDIDSGTKTFDIWFDNIFTDFHVRDQIISQIRSVNDLSSELYKLKDKLELKRDKAVGELKAATEALENIVMD